MTLRDLHWSPASRWNHINVIPSILVREEGNPASIGRGQWFSSRLPIRQAPELFLVIFVNGFRLAVFHVGDVYRARLELIGLSGEYDAARVDPGECAVVAFGADRYRSAARCRDRKQHAGNILRVGVNELRPGIRGRGIMWDGGCAADVTDL